MPHQEQFSADDAYRCMDSAERLLIAVSSPLAEQINSEKALLMREKYQQQTRDERKKKGAMLPGLEGTPTSGLTPWRDVVTPHPDVQKGDFLQAEFAADLWQVYRGEAKSEYGDPVQFFRRTYMTEGLKILLGTALDRICGTTGDPIIELQTNFGGGKTHAMLGLYHMFSGTPFAELLGVEELVQDKEINEKAMAVRRAVLVGTRIAPGQPTKKDDGTIVHTIWGELAWQLGGKEGYAMVAESDCNASSPGEALHDVIKKYSPCLILIDEWVAYARQLHDDDKLCGGSFETQFTFAQALTETVKNIPHAMMIASIPASDASASPHMQTQTEDIEIGGEKGMQALQRLKHVIGRTESAWRPASQEESYAIVRRRLFDDITDAKAFKLRDSVIDSFREMYGTHGQEFPKECSQEDYSRKMQACYPIHPELFDRLYNEWSSLARFQRTRGVLRLMASVIHSLWDRLDASLMILPASIPIDDLRVQSELTRYLEPNWIPVIERDVDGANSLARRLDNSTSTLGRYSACRRVARTIYMASAPTAKTPHKGADDQHVKLGCVQPGESIATFGDALRRLIDQAMHLYAEKDRYWFDTQPTVQRLARDKANDIKPEFVIEEIEARLAQDQKSSSDFPRVHACPVSSSDVADERCAKLVILPPSEGYKRNKDDSKALIKALEILENRGSSPRQYRNTLVFLAADSVLMQPLDEAVRLYLAWTSIDNDKGADGLNLDPNQARQVGIRLKQASETVDQQIQEVYCWLLVPGMSGPTSKGVEWQPIKLSGQESLNGRAWKRLQRDQAIYSEMGGVPLRIEMDRIPLWQENHLDIRTLADYFAKYLYLPRLRDDSVLERAIAEGTSLLTWEQDSFAYAEAWDEDAGRYQGLRGGTPVHIAADSPGMLVKPDVAKAQIAEEQKSAEPDTTEGETKPPDDGDSTTGGTDPEPTKKEPTRFHGSITLDSARVSRDAGKVAEEVIQHLVGQMGSDVEVTLEIQAKLPFGTPDNVVRTVTENCRTLKFDDAGFEDE